MSDKSSDYPVGETKCIDLNSNSLSKLTEGDSITVTVNADLGNKITADLAVEYKAGVN